MHQKSRDLAGEMGPVPTSCIPNCTSQLMIIPTYYAPHVYFFTLKCKNHKQDSFLTKLSSGNHSTHENCCNLDLCSNVPLVVHNLNS